MKKQNDLIADRLKNIMATNRTSNIGRLLVILKSDICSLLSNYMNAEFSKIRVAAEENAEGGYIFKITAAADNIYDCGKMVD